MFSDELQRLREGPLLRQICDRDLIEECSGEGTTRSLARILLNGIEYVNFASNDYLGLATDRRLIESAKGAADCCGIGSGASRLLSGGTGLHGRLEKIVCEWKGTEAALLFNSGYSANIAALSSLPGEGDIILSDELNHASIIDGCRLSRARRVIYRHADVGHLSELLKTERANRRFVVTDSVFSMDGDIAPLKEIYSLCLRHGALLYIDDAHGTGVLGDGQGALRHFDLTPEPWIMQMGTFSKALGSFGAFIAGSKDILDWLINTARPFIFSTVLPSCLIAASIVALQILAADKTPVERLWQNREKLIGGIRKLGFNTLCSETPIIPLVVGDVETTMKISEALKGRRLYVPAIRPPTVKIPRLRVSVTASHTESDIARLIGALSESRRGLPG